MKSHVTLRATSQSQAADIAATAGFLTERSHLGHKGWRWIIVF